MSSQQKIPKQGPGFFQWHAGNWFGAQLGSTLWMALGSALFLWLAPILGVIWLSCFLLANAIGFVLWSRRDRLLPYPTLQRYLGCLTVLCAVPLITSQAFLNVQGKPPMPWAACLTLVIFPVMMVLFYFKEKAARDQNLSKPIE